MQCWLLSVVSRHWGLSVAKHNVISSIVFHSVPGQPHCGVPGQPHRGVHWPMLLTVLLARIASDIVWRRFCLSSNDCSISRWIYYFCCCCITVVPDYHGVVRAIKGQAVILKCTVAPGDLVKWIQVQKHDTQFFYIYTNGSIRYENLKSRYSVSDAATGNYTMTILDIQLNDAGRYFCLRGDFNEKPHFVTDNEMHLLAATLKLYIVYVDGKKSVQFTTIMSRLLLQLHIEFYILVIVWSGCRCSGTKSVTALICSSRN